MHCSECGHGLSKDDRFCAECGAAIGDRAERSGTGRSTRRHRLVPHWVIWSAAAVAVAAVGLAWLTGIGRPGGEVKESQATGRGPLTGATSGSIEVRTEPEVQEAIVYVFGPKPAGGEITRDREHCREGKVGERIGNLAPGEYLVVVAAEDYLEEVSTQVAGGGEVRLIELSLQRIPEHSSSTVIPGVGRVGANGRVIRNRNAADGENAGLEVAQESEGPVSQSEAERFVEDWLSLCKRGKYDQADEQLHRLTRNFYGAWDVDIVKELGKAQQQATARVTYLKTVNEDELGRTILFSVTLDRDELEFGVVVDQGRKRIFITPS